MANILRDFFILEFAIYNIGNVTKQFRWIAGGLSDVTHEFMAMDKIISDINKNTQKLRELEALANSLKNMAKQVGMTDEIATKLAHTGTSMVRIQREIKRSAELLENMNVRAYVSNKLFSNLAALIATKFGVLSLVFKTFLDNFVRLEREAISLSNALGIPETRAFAISKAFENVGLNAGQFANALTQFQTRFFRDFRLPLLLTRFGIDVSNIFRGGVEGRGIRQLSGANILGFVEEIQKVGNILGRLPPFQRAFLAQTLGKDLVDMATVLRRYNISQLIRDYMKVFTPEMITQTRLTITQLQLTVAEFWKIIIPFVNRLSAIIRTVSGFLRSIGEFYENNRLFRAIMNTLLLFGSLGVTFISAIYAIRLYRNSVESLSIAYAIGKFYIDKATASLFQFTAQMENVSQIAGVAKFMQSGIGIGAITTSLIATAFTGILGIIGLSYIFGELRGTSKVVGDIRDSSFEIANNTALTNVYLSNLSADIRTLIKTTALGGSVAPFYQIMNLQMMMQYSLMTNTSAI